jgi:hypothetical protein
MGVTIKLTGSGSDFDSKYLENDSTKPIPNFNGVRDLANNYSGLDSRYKWTNQAELDRGRIAAAFHSLVVHFASANIPGLMPRFRKRSRDEGLWAVRAACLIRAVNFFAPIKANSRPPPI